MTSRDHNIATTLLTWHRNNRRSFPWRVNPDPYRVLVAEFFLQRTPANRVAQFYPSFLAEFPSSERLSTANPARLKKLGHRLGLEKRMSWLVRSAKMICQEHGGKVPNKLDDLTQLPGVGPYTASAVLCFGFGQDVPIVDANVVRVVTRIFGLSGTPKAQNSAIDGIAQKLVPKNRAVTYNEALLDFAATVCKKNPLCVVCPLTRSCAYCRKLRNENLKN